MSFLVDKLAKHAGDIVADKIKSALGGGDDDDDKKKNHKDKDDKDGGFLSIFKRDKEDDDDDDHKGGLFSFGRDKEKSKDKDDNKGSFFHRVFHRDDDDDRDKVSKKSGFAGLFSEQEQPGGAAPAPAPGEPCDHMSEGDLDLMSDLMEVANETS